MKRAATMGLLLGALALGALADVNSIDEKDEPKLWPINEKTQKIPKYTDSRTGFIDPKTEQTINEANDKYDPESRQEIIDFCRHQAFVKKTQLQQKPLVAKRLKDKTDGLLNELQEEFQYCAVGMINSWARDEAQADKDKKR